MIEDALIIGFAAWRVAHLLVEEDGPFDIFEKLRQFAGVRSGLVEGFWPKLFSCVWCMSVWVCVLVYGLLLLEQTIVMILAAMAIAALLQKFSDR